MGRTKQRARQQLFKPTHGPYNIKLGKFTAKGVSLFEAAINNVVLRIRLEGIHSVKKKKKVPITKKGPANRSLRDKKEPVVENVSVNRSLRDKTPHNKSLNNNHNDHSLSPVINNNIKRKVIKTSDHKLHSTKRYFLEFEPVVKCQRSKITLSFTRLTELLNSLTLPKLWKVTVVMKSDLTAVYKFIDQGSERCVAISEIDPYYKVLINGVSVILLGCPETVDTLKDIELLLDIVNRLSLKDCMVSRV